MRSLTDPRTASVTEIVDALLLYDEPALNHRFHNLLTRLVDDAPGVALEEIPRIVAHSERLIRQGAVDWERHGGGLPTVEFIRRGEHVLLEAFLHLTESQIRLISFMARNAPTRDVRAVFDEAVEGHREVAHTLRDALRKPPEGMTPTPVRPEGIRGAQEEDSSSDLRSQVENAILACRATGHEPRRLILSPVAVRHLRDQGLLREGATEVMSVSVEVDIAWDASAFALRSYDSVPLEDILASEGARERA